LALTASGEVYAAGYNISGQIGDGTTYNTPTPVALPAASFGDKTLGAISGGAAYTLARMTDGSLYAWGANAYGQVGTGVVNLTNLSGGGVTPIIAPANTPQLLSTGSIAAAVGGGNHSLAVTTSGKLLSWGYNLNGQLGNGTATDATVPTMVPENALIAGKNFAYVAANLDASVALTTDGQLFSWGNNASGQLGNGATGNSSSPALVGSLLQGKTVAAIAGSSSACYALTTDGQLYAWGAGTNGQLGTGSTATALWPVLVTGALSGKRIVAVRPGNNHVLALGDDGQIYAWGFNTSGQLGNNSTTTISTPVAVAGLSGKTIVSIAAANNTSLALTSLGELFAWGDNSAGGVGDGFRGTGWWVASGGADDGDAVSLAGVFRVSDSVRAFDRAAGDVAGEEG
jgi:alpha-tubulin suppressor-like RCC1 family protein